MKKHLPVEELARDGRFWQTRFEQSMRDPRVIANRAKAAERPAGTGGGRGQRFSPDDKAAPEAARALMHGIFMGEIQALEAAGRTAFDFEAETEVPFQLKLDMARQCWDEARHVEISVKLTEWMGTEIGEYAESTFLYEAACNRDPAMRLTGVNRALEGLAIDVFTTMKAFGEKSGDPVTTFCEDWMLADEVTHVKMGSDWLRKLTADDPERRARALEFQKVVDKLFSLGGQRSDREDSPVRLARRFRELAGFTTEEIDEIAGLAEEAAADIAKRLAASAPATKS